MKPNLSIESLEERAFSYITEAKHHYGQVQFPKNGIGTALVRDLAEERKQEFLDCMMNHVSLSKYIEDVVEHELGKSGGDSDDLH